MTDATSNTSNTGWIVISAVLPAAMRKIPMNRSSVITSRDNIKLLRISSIKA
ncbi:hypothetical protein D3C72_2363720 [compost metagenome]